MRRLTGPDVVTLAYLAAVTLIVLAARPAGMAVFLALHALTLILAAAVIAAHNRRGGRLWTFLRHWYVLPLTLAAFREIHYLVPRVHPFEDRRYDMALAAIDRKCLGDVDGFFLSLANPILVDVLHLCYWSYFAYLVIPAAVLYARGELDKARAYASVILTGLYTTYLGYFAVPAVGPHHFYPQRPPELDGWILGGHLHRLLMWMELEMPDVFPSGHTLLSLLVLLTTWRYHRRSFWFILGPASGCIAATVILRYHYVVDLVASVALLPAAYLGGTALHRRLETVNEIATRFR